MVSAKQLEDISMRTHVHIGTQRQFSENICSEDDLRTFL